MYNPDNILNEKFLMDIILEAITAGDITSDYDSGDYMSYIPVQINKVIFSKSVKEIFNQEKLEKERTFLLEHKVIAIPKCKIDLPENTKIIVHTGGVPIQLKKYGEDLLCTAIYTLDKNKDIKEIFSEDKEYREVYE